MAAALRAPGSSPSGSLCPQPAFRQMMAASAGASVQKAGGAPRARGGGRCRLDAVSALRHYGGMMRQTPWEKIGISRVEEGRGGLRSVSFAE